MEVMNGDKEEEELEEGDEGGGRGIVEISWRERESTTEMEDPEGKARRPEEERSMEPKLLRDGGPGSMQSQVDSVVCDGVLGRDIALEIEMRVCVGY